MLSRERDLEPVYTFAKVAAMLKLGKKYDVEYQYKRAIQCLEQTFPSTLRNWDIRGKAAGTLWCRTPSHRYFCATEIGRPILPGFLIPLVKMVQLTSSSKCSDRFLFG